MIRIALAYLGITVLGILLVTGLPFGLGGGQNEAPGLADAASDVTPSTLLAAVQAARALQATREVSLEDILAQSLSAGQTVEDIDKLINAAVGQGSVRVPVMLLTTEGRVDTEVLIASILMAAQSPSTEQGDTSTDDSFVTPETAVLDIQDMLYTVLRDDSLGSLSRKFYGTPAYFAVILQANRAVLTTPSSLRAGQVLVIPSRSKL